MSVSGSVAGGAYEYPQEYLTTSSVNLASGDEYHNGNDMWASAKVTDPCSLMSDTEASQMVGMDVVGLKYHNTVQDIYQCAYSPSGSSIEYSEGGGLYHDEYLVVSMRQKDPNWTDPQYLRDEGRSGYVDDITKLSADVPGLDTTYPNYWTASIDGAVSVRLPDFDFKVQYNDNPTHDPSVDGRASLRKDQQVSVQVANLILPRLDS